MYKLKYVLVFFLSFLFIFPYSNVFAKNISIFDNTIDDTFILQEQIDALPYNGILDGEGKTYIVTSLILKSNITIKNFYFTTKGGDEDFVSPITIGSNYSPETTSNVTIQNVHIYGNRANQTSIGSLEDGGRHGFRILGHVNNLLLENCSASYCASDGLCIYSGFGGGDFPKATNIIVKDCSFNWNRRHGCSGDSINNASFINVEFNDNGQDLDNASLLNDGEKGVRTEGKLYGNGIDMEGYGIGSANSNIFFSNISALRNASTGVLFYDVSKPTDGGFISNNHIYLFNSRVDYGTDSEPNKNPYAIEFTSAFSNRKLGPVFSNIFLFNNIIYGELSFRAVDKVYISGGQIINDNETLGNLDQTTNIYIFDFNNEFYNFNSDSSTLYDLSSYNFHFFRSRLIILRP